jgi:excisionase family DNA binding protein
MWEICRGAQRSDGVGEYLNIQRTARRLGVSASTVRRWTATGLLSCERTPGGHRRIAAEDVDELGRSLGGGQLAARRARERELETILDVSAALTSQLELPVLLLEIARAMTRLADVGYCAVSEYDERTRRVRTLAEYDATGRRVPEAGDYHVAEFPLTRRVLQDQTEAVVNVDDRWADAAEVAELRRGGDQSILILPLVQAGRSIGLIELTDSQRTRSYDRQQLRVFRAVAGQAAVALHNARTFENLSRSADGSGALRETLSRLAAAVPDAVAATSLQDLLQRVAGHACDALDALSCVAACGDVSAGASRPAHGRPSGTSQVLVGCAVVGPAVADRASADPAGAGSATPAVSGSGRGAPALDAPQAGNVAPPADAPPVITPPVVTLTVALAGPAHEGQAELLDLIATAASAAVSRFSTQ